MSLLMVEIDKLDHTVPHFHKSNTVIQHVQHVQLQGSVFGTVLIIICMDGKLSVISQCETIKYKFIMVLELNFVYLSHNVSDWFSQPVLGLNILTKSKNHDELIFDMILWT